MDQGESKRTSEELRKLTSELKAKSCKRAREALDIQQSSMKRFQERYELVGFATEEKPPFQQLSSSVQGSREIPKHTESDVNELVHLRAACDFSAEDEVMAVRKLKKFNGDADEIRAPFTRDLTRTARASSGC